MSSEERGTRNVRAPEKLFAKDDRSAPTPASGEVDPNRVEMPARVLVVDDDPAIRLLLRNTFKRDCEVAEAEDGSQGFRVFEEFRPDFIVTDLMMPVVDGHQFIQMVRRTYIGVGTPILVVTAKTEEGVLLECFREGADDFITKPFSPNELRTRVASIHLRSQVARDVNPLSKLPGNFALKREMERWLERGTLFGIGYIDLDHFKAFNDIHGFDTGDEAILVMANAVVEYAQKLPFEEIFVSHVGGDDFVLLIPFDKIEDMASSIHASFTKGIQRFYTEDELAAGKVQIIDRTGTQRLVPLLSASIAVVHNKREGIDDVRKVAQIAAETKKMAKAIPGNSLFIDRRTS